jgi:hypothetical protein
MKVEEARWLDDDGGERGRNREFKREGEIEAWLVWLG